MGAPKGNCNACGPHKMKGRYSRSSHKGPFYSGRDNLRLKKALADLRKSTPSAVRLRRKASNYWWDW